MYNRNLIEEGITRYKFPPLPVRYEDVVKEICAYTNCPRDEVAIRVWQEALHMGWNVSKDAETYGVTPHFYNNKMETLYRDGLGFIYETLVHWSYRTRQIISVNALDRIYNYSTMINVDPKNLSILILGDGAGSDTIFLASNGLNVDYFDFPGSKTYEFAVRRFNGYNLLGDKIYLIHDHQSCFKKQYDVIISFDVLEHLPDPLSMVVDFKRLLKPLGIVLVTDGFGAVSNCFPTHLKCNSKYNGLTPFIFQRFGMKLSWYSQDPLFKPLEFVSVNQRRRLEFLMPLFNKIILTEVFVGQTRRLKYKLKNVLLKS